MRYLLIVACVACGETVQDAGPASDLGDAGFVDTGAFDAGFIDAGAPDTGIPEIFEGTLASGTLALPAATAFGDPGFHEVLMVSATAPDGSGPALSTTGQRLVLSLSDETRPGMSCGQDHPTSGCATVDHSDFEGRPGVPAGGVFDNRVTLQLTSGPRSYYISETRGLADDPDPYSPT